MIHKILLTDANRSVNAIHSSALSEAGYEVNMAQDAGELSTQLGCGKLSLVIGELAFPDFAQNDPLSLVRWVLSIRPGIPLLVLTSNSNRMAHREARKLGVWDICVKPTPCAELLSLTQNILTDVYRERPDGSRRLSLDHAEAR